MHSAGMIVGWQIGEIAGSFNVFDF